MHGRYTEWAKIVKIANELRKRPRNEPIYSNSQPLDITTISIVK